AASALGASRIGRSIVQRPAGCIGECERAAALYHGVARDGPSRNQLRQSTLGLAEGKLVVIAHGEALRTREVTGSVLLGGVGGVVAIGLAVSAQIAEVLAPSVSCLHRE